MNTFIKEVHKLQGNARRISHPVQKAFKVAEDWFNITDSLGNELDNMGGKL